MIVFFITVVGWPIVKSQLSDCSILTLSDLGSNGSFTQEGLLANSLNNYRSNNTLDYYYWIFDFNIICLSQGSEKDKYTSTSVIIAYFVKDDKQTSHKIGLFHFRCLDYNWALNLITVVEKTVTTSALAHYLNHTVKKMCWICTELIIDVATMNVEDHCLGK